MKVLVIAPHPDDEVLGCGGTLCRHAADGDEISAVFLTSGELGLKKLPHQEAWAIREKEARAAAKILGIRSLQFLHGADWGLAESLPSLTNPLGEVLVQEQADCIYLPHPQDGHPDHQATLPLLRAAFAGAQTAPPELRAYEVWTPLPEHDHVVDISAFMTRKLRALRAHGSQLGGDFDYARAIRGLNQYRGALSAHCRFAEVFKRLSLEPSR